MHSDKNSTKSNHPARRMSSAATSKPDIRGRTELGTKSTSKQQTWYRSSQTPVIAFYEVRAEAISQGRLFWNESHLHGTAFRKETYSRRKLPSCPNPAKHDAEQP